MPFSENLYKARKALGLSQDDLAEKIGVSRQAVSKWECNDATPDLPKLLALSDVLKVDLDSLCDTGFSTDANTRSESVPRFSRKKKVIIICVAVLSACVLLAGSFCLGARFESVSTQPSSESANKSAVLPDTLTVSGVNFSCDVDGLLSYRFTPGYIHPDLTYKISFASSFDAPQVFEVVYENGVCSGSLANLRNSGPFNVTLIVCSGDESRAVPLAYDLCFSNGEATWNLPE